MSITNQLALFVDVVQQGSFAKAAALNDMDNSSLSKQIKKLESSLGVQLLNRSTRSFSLTSAGDEILQQAHILIDTLSDIHSIADSYQAKPKGILRITSGMFFGQQYIQPVINIFMQKYPEVKITLMLDDKRNDIISDHYDLAFRIGKLDDSNLMAKKISDMHFALVASNDFIARHGMPNTPEELLALPAIVYGNGDVSLDQIKLSTQPHGDKYKTHKMKGNYKVSDVRAMLDATKAGLGYVMLDLFNLEKPIDEMGLVPLLTNYKLSASGTGIYALYPHRKQTPLVSEFIKTVQEYIGSPAFWVKHIPNYKQLYK
ncbi:LysR family transcriptional regulator [Pseudoalteromonas carrageenovora]|uniref:LysR family transcriptional regulator n=1 Tax=Pseudoalteromonas carrageenovora TaxID=227 RepID=UPI0026E1CF9C|nr:LysR family transcriptional regulator [Pseudoalteromonas carrageenovora]MDO6463556.1 LysR family transcriptional regulator [Pseudoalteromonas carrageenovora]